MQYEKNSIQLFGLINKIENYLNMNTIKNNLTDIEIKKIVKNSRETSKRYFLKGWRTHENFMIQSFQQENAKIIELLKESRDLLLLQALLDKHNNCINMVNKIDNILNKQY
jgi:hypothetical protein